MLPACRPNLRTLETGLRLLGEMQPWPLIILRGEMRVCSGAGCLRTVPDDVRFCPVCAPKAEPDDGIRSYTPAEPEGIREHSTADRDRLGHLYGGPRWKKHTQPAVLRRDPICKRCDKDLSTIADHVVPASEAIRQAQASGRWPLNAVAGFYLMSNLQGLCRSCHKLKTDEDKAHSGPWPDVVAKELTAPKKKWSF